MKVKYFVLAPVALSVAMTLGVAEAAKKTQDEEDSVYRWGRWEILSPEAGPQPVGNIPRQVSQLSADDFLKTLKEKTQPTDPEPIPVDPEPEPQPVIVCAAGAACGFATRNDGRIQRTSDGAVINSFDLNVSRDGGEVSDISFTLNGGETDEASSDVMDDVVVGRRTAQATDGDNTSGLVMSAYFDPAKGFWNHHTQSEGQESGYFVWGAAAPQDLLNSLNAGNVVANFAGYMNSAETFVNMTVNFGVDPSWSAGWSGAHNFGAAGDVNGASLVATEIVEAEGSVAGFLTGNIQNDIGAIMAVDVVTANGQYTDVGYIRGGYENID